VKRLEATRRLTKRKYTATTPNACRFQAKRGKFQKSIRQALLRRQLCATLARCRRPHPFGLPWFEAAARQTGAPPAA